MVVTIKCGGYNDTFHGCNDVKNFTVVSISRKKCEVNRKLSWVLSSNENKLYQTYNMMLPPTHNHYPPENGDPGKTAKSSHSSLLDNCRNCEIYPGGQ